MSLELILEPLGFDRVKSAAPEPHLLETAFGKKNRIMVSDPRLNSLTPLDFGLTTARARKMEQPGHELVTASTTISFLPDIHCEFVSADLSFAFSCDEVPVHPLVCDLRPREVVRERNWKQQHTKGTKVTGSMTAGLAKVLSEMSGSNTFEEDGKTMVRNIYGFGLQFREAGWRFQASPEHQLAGIYEDFAFLISKPSRALLRAELKMVAEIAVNTLLDRWATLAFGLSRRADIPERQYELVLG